MFMNRNRRTRRNPSIQNWRNSECNGAIVRPSRRFKVLKKQETVTDFLIRNNKECK